ncbi:MAG: hypothetical protein IPK81_20960 [Rhodospirillales bacterium]|nr:MAG: hypothetical protein IPK81_20960 [Rhodospirillales bacterium]
MPRYLPHALSFLAGFLSLSQEILWTRLVAFSFGGIPQAFAFVLATYLLGIALGADIGKDLCRRASARGLAGVDLQRALLRHCGWVFVIAAGIDVAGPWLFALAHGSAVGSGVAALAMITTALVKSVLFPIVHQLGAGADTRRLGGGFSKVYCANILGSTCGPLVTGFYLLDVVSLQTALALVAASSAVLGATLLAAIPRAAGESAPLPESARASSRRQEALLRMFTPPAARATLADGGVVVALAGAALLGPFNLVETVVERGLARDPNVASTEVRHLVENRHGIVHTLVDSARGDIVFGDGVYDGRVNLDPRTNANRIDRMFYFAAAAQDARRVLVIGLSAGAWTRLLQGLPNLERIDAVEINPGYVELIRRYPAVAPLLDDRRIVVHVDDGRRWLKRHPAERYDLIVMNTSVHWRAYATNLLSREFLEIARGHLNPGSTTAASSSMSTTAAAGSSATRPSDTT